MVAEGDSNRELTRLMTKAGRLQFIMLMAVFLGFVAVGRPFVILWAGGKEQFAVDYPVALLLFASTIVPPSSLWGWRSSGPRICTGSGPGSIWPPPPSMWG